MMEREEKDEEEEEKNTRREEVWAISNRCRPLFPVEKHPSVTSKQPLMTSSPPGP